MFAAGGAFVDAARHAAILPRALRRRDPSADPSPPIVLCERAERLELLVCAVFARRFAIRPATCPPPGNPFARLWAGRRAPSRTAAPVPATDGASIWLPPALPGVDPCRAGAIYRALALSQASRAQRGAARVAEGIVDPLERSCFLLLEAWSTQECLAVLLPGVRPALATLADEALARRPRPARFSASRRPLEELARSVLEGRAGDVPVCPSALESLDVARRLAARLRRAPGAGTGQADDASLYVDLWTGELLSAPPQPGAAADEAVDQRTTASVAAAIPIPARPKRVREARQGENWDAVGGWIAKSLYPLERLEDPMGFQRPTEGENGAASERSADSMSSMAEARRVAATGAPKDVQLSDEVPAQRARHARDRVFAAGDELSYPEWDWKRRAYRRPGAVVRIGEPPLGPQAWVERTVKAHATRLAQVGRQFEALRAQPVRLPRQLDGDEIDLDAFIESRCDFRAGRSLSQAVYALHRPARRDLALMLLVDVSSSTDAWLTHDRRIIDVEREALLLLCLAMRRLGHRYSVLAFSGKGPSCVTIRPIKRFDEGYGAVVGRRIAALQPERFTRAGAAVRHACALLMREPATHRLLLMLSDGKPNDIDDYDGRYGVEDLRQSVVEARLQGISAFCLTVDHQAADYLTAVFGVNHCALPRPEWLSTALLEWVRRLVRA